MSKEMEKEMEKEVVKTSTKKKTTASKSADKTVPKAKQTVEPVVTQSEFEQLKAMFLKSEENNQALRDQVATLTSQNTTQSTQTQDYGTSYFTSSIKIVHLVERTPSLFTTIRLSNLTIKMSKFGETRNLSVQQFEELVGSYRSFFEKGILSLDAADEDKAQFYGLQTIKNFPLTSEFVHSLGSKKMEDIEAIYPKLPSATKDFIIGYWKRKIHEGDNAFKSPAKIDFLNRITDGGMTDIIAEREAERQKAK